MDALTLHRIHFAFTITYHYLFPQLTIETIRVGILPRLVCLSFSHALWSRSRSLPRSAALHKFHRPEHHDSQRACRSAHP
jgi:hypothetical protein